ncbi:MAG: type IV pilus biogenesis/stability protein PilW [Marinicellaceae bacterium]
MKLQNIIISFACLFILISCGNPQNKKSTSNRTQNIETVKAGSPEKVNLDLGVGYLKRGRDGDMDIAIEKLKKSLSYNPQYALAHSVIANVYDQKGLFDDAVKHYKLSIKYNNNNPDIINNYANYLCQRGSYDDAINYYLQIVNNPQYQLAAYAYENAGICSYKAMKISQAEKYFRESVQINANQTNALYYLMRISKDSKNFMNARAFLQRLEGQFNPSPELLFAGYEIENALGNTTQANTYLTDLRKKFPSSEFLNNIK